MVSFQEIEFYNYILSGILNPKILIQELVYNLIKEIIKSKKETICS